MKRILVTRFSAMGDVAMVASVLQEFVQQHPEVQIIMLSRKFFAPFFAEIPQVRFHAIEPDGKHKGFAGMFKLFQELKTQQIDAVANLHDNIRSNILSFYFKCIGIPVRKIDKGRAEKKALTRPKNKIKKQLKLTTERYADVFRSLGFPLSLSHQLKKQERPLPAAARSFFQEGIPVLGIAPFAQHPYKVFAKERMEAVFAYFQGQPIRFIIFGGGASEKAIAESWEQQFPQVSSSIGKFNLTEELQLISHLNLMLSMDSSGMHMASLVGTRSLSIWGATHPYAGFLGYGQQDSDCIQVEHPARPSSVYGNKPCLCDGVEAIDLVTAEQVIEKIKISLIV